MNTTKNNCYDEKTQLVVHFSSLLENDDKILGDIDDSRRYDHSTTATIDTTSHPNPLSSLSKIFVVVGIMMMMSMAYGHLNVTGGHVPPAAVSSLASPLTKSQFSGMIGEKSSLSILPRMIVFDLDSTLWIPESWELDQCPSIPLLGRLTGRDDEEAESVIGLMVPPSGPTVHFLDGALEVLQWLAATDEDIILAVASTSEEPTYSEACLNQLEVFPGLPVGNLFQYAEIGRTGYLTRKKQTHFETIHAKSGVPYDEMLFFDDCFWSDNVGKVYDVLGVIGERTPDGLTMEKFKDGLERYQNARLK